MSPARIVRITSLRGDDLEEVRYYTVEQDRLTEYLHFVRSGRCSEQLKADLEGVRSTAVPLFNEQLDAADPSTREWLVSALIQGNAPELTADYELRRQLR